MLMHERSSHFRPVWRLVSVEHTGQVGRNRVLLRSHVSGDVFNSGRMKLQKKKAATALPWYLFALAPQGSKTRVLIVVPGSYPFLVIHRVATSVILMWWVRRMNNKCFGPSGAEPSARIVQSFHRLPLSRRAPESFGPYVLRKALQSHFHAQ